MLASNFLLVLFACLSASAWGLAPIVDEGGDDPLVENEYIVVFKETRAPQDTVSAMMDEVMERAATMARSAGPGPVPTLMACDVDAQGRVPRECPGKMLYADMSALTVHVGNDAGLEAIRAQPEVAYVQQSRYAKTGQSQQLELEDDEKASVACSMDLKPVSWGLDHVDGVVDNLHRYPTSSGQGATVYVVDSGIHAAHSDFQGRATVGPTFCKDSGQTPCKQGRDINGHGTHCAGTVGGKTVGVAKKVKLIGVKSLNDKNYGSWADIIAGINWAAQDWKSKGKKTAVISLSIVGGKYSPVDKAVTNAVNSGLTTIICAGNDNKDACTASPCTAKGGICVANHNAKNIRRFDSNYGKCTHIWAPGDKIVSTKNANSGWRTMSGTSMSTPHVAGLSAMYLLKNPSAKPSDVLKWMQSKAVNGVLKDIKSGSPNKKFKAGCSDM